MSQGSCTSTSDEKHLKLETEAVEERARRNDGNGHEQQVGVGRKAW